MCGRYSLGTEEENIRFREIINKTNETAPVGHTVILNKNGDIYPGDNAPAATSERSIVQYRSMRWGFESQGKLVINARSETADTKPMFRRSIESMRCLIPAAGYYEWNERKEKYFFTDPNGEILYLAGLYRYNTEGFSEFTILTRDAYGTYNDIHHRMPLIIRKNEPWLEDACAAKKLLKSGGDIKLDVIPASPQQLSMF